MNELEMKRTPEIIAAEIRALTATMLRNVIEIGRRMVEAKELLPHGEFGPWLQENTGYSQRTANNFMKLFEEYGEPQSSMFGAETKSQSFANFPYSKALALLSVPESEREQFAKTVDAEALSVKELREAIRAREAAEAKTKAAEEAAQAERNRADGYCAKLEQAQHRAAEQLAQAEEAAAQARERAETLTARIAELEAAPKETEPVADEAAIRQAAEAARQAEREKLNRELTKAKKASEKAEAARQKAEQALAGAKVAAEERAAVDRAEKDALTGQLDELRKKLAVASSAEITVFKLHFEQAQAAIGKMRECIQTIRKAGDIEGAGKLSSALCALCEATQRAME